jgi:REase_MTES_1575/Transcriptional regulator, AbiEi antitoxin
MRRELEVRAREREIARLADGQHGVVGRVQLLSLGFSARAIDRRLERGRLHAVHRGVYAVGHRLVTPKAVWMAGVLAGGPGAVLSHQTAAALWDLLRSAGAPHVTVPGRAGQRLGLRVHCGRFERDEITIRDAIPTTTVARTLLDLAAAVPVHRLEWAIAEAERRRLADSPSLPDLLARYPGRRGIAALRAILADRRLGLDVPRSELEARFVAFLDRHGLPRPERNGHLSVGGRTFEIDCLWKEARLAVELDSREWHSDRDAFEADRARDRALVAGGWRPIRVTWRHLHRAPERLANELRAALARPTSS